MLYELVTVLPFLLCLFWTVLFLLDYHSLYSPQKVFLVYLVVCTLLYLSHALFFNRIVSAFKLMEGIYAFCTIAVYPLFYLYITSLTNEMAVTKKRLWVLTPAVVIGLSAIFFYLFMSKAEHLQFVNTLFYGKESLPPEAPWYMKAQSIRVLVMKVVFAVQIIPVGYFGIKHLRDFEDKIQEFYSNTENRSVKKVRAMLITFIVFSLCSIVVNYLGRQYFSNRLLLITMMALIFSVLLYALAYISYKQTFSIEELNRDLKEGDENRVECEAPETDKELKEKILQLMQEEEFFRKKDLRLTDMAQELCSNRTYISKLINQEFQMTFSDFVNSYRIDYFKKSVMDHRTDGNWLDRIEMAGFTSEGTFYRNFKKFTGTTPEKWQKTMGIKW